MKNIFIVFCFLILIFGGCSKNFLETQPTDQITTSVVFSNQQNFLNALNGIHRSLYLNYGTQGRGGLGALFLNYDFLGEDLVMTPGGGNGWFVTDYRWGEHRDNQGDVNYFSYIFFYSIISNANYILNNLDGVKGDIKTLNMIKGESLVYRAWSYFNLVQLFGERYDATKTKNDQLGVPLILNTSLEAKHRSSVEEVYIQINKDLDSGISNLSNASVAPNKSHINLSVAKGIKARVALTQQNWLIAAKFAVDARTDYSLMSNADYVKGFNDYTNVEWMWGSKIIPDQSLYFSSYFAYISCNFNSTNIRSNPKLINNKLYAKMASTDVRTKVWLPFAQTTQKDKAIRPTPTSTVRNFMTQKFLAASAGASDGDIPIMRAAEMYLIEAEANANLGNNNIAKKALYTLMNNRDPNYVMSTSVGQVLLDEIYTNRRIELWGEGFRFFDLKRLNLGLDRNGLNHDPATINNFYSVPPRDKQWQFLIPKREVDNNPKMVQNP